MTEFNRKQALMQNLLAEKGLEALLIRKVSSFAWATCGAASYVNTAATEGAATLLITPASRYLIADNIEATRLDEEEGLQSQGWDFQISPWHETDDAVAKLARGLKVGSDSPYPGATDLSSAMSRLRTLLMPEEAERFRELGRLCAAAMDAAVRAVRPGQTEYQIAGLLAREAESRGAQTTVNLIATDERIFSFRHPLPTGKTLDRYAMLVLCGRRHGLVCSLTRLVHFGALSEALRRKAEAVSRVDAALIAATRPGESVQGIFQRGVTAYEEAGFPDEWRLHHQGGAAGYEPREFIATPTSEEVVEMGQAYAWNPSITGTKSEDTVLVGETENEILTAIDEWPTMSILIDGREINRPAILEVS